MIFRTRGRSSEAGQSLVLVLVLIAVFSILASSLLGLASTNALVMQKFNIATKGRIGADVGVEYGANQVNENAISSTVNQRQVVLVPATVDGIIVSTQVDDVTITSATIGPPGAGCLVAAGTLPLTATAQSLGTPRSVAPVWSVDAQTPTATITQAGVFAAPSPAVTVNTVYRVRITYNNVSSTKDITVKPAGGTCP